MKTSIEFAEEIINTGYPINSVEAIYRLAVEIESYTTMKIRDHESN